MSEGRKARGVKLVMLVSLLAVGGMVGLSAWAQPEGGRPEHRMHHGQHHGGKSGHMGLGGPGLFMGSPERIDRAVDRVLKGVDATEAQRTQVKQIARAAAADLKPIHETARGLRAQQMQLFAAPVVDARAVEASRAQLVAQHDQASRRISQAMLDISTVLTPEQRARLAQQAQQRRERMKERLQSRAFERRGAASAPVQ
ncbi:MAG TPA: Spy/CpxP family protein refolding chaperone [Rhizobacter sp.]